MPAIIATIEEEAVGLTQEEAPPEWSGLELVEHDLGCIGLEDDARDRGLAFTDREGEVVVAQPVGEAIEITGEFEPCDSG